MIKKKALLESHGREIKIFLIISIALFTLNFISASIFGYNSNSGTVITVGGNKTVYTNYTTYSYDTGLGVNLTQLNNATLITIKESWLNSIFVRIENLSSYIISMVGNWSADKDNYYTKAEEDSNLSLYNTTLTNLISSAVNCNGGTCNTIFYWANQSFLNETDLINLVNTTLEGRIDIMNLTNWTDIVFTTYDSRWNGGNNSWNESFARSLFVSNTTAGIQYLINSTGVYLYSYNQTTAAFNLYNNTWDNSWVNTWAFNQTANLVLNGDNESWNESHSNTLYTNKTGYNATQFETIAGMIHMPESWLVGKINDLALSVFNSNFRNWNDQDLNKSDNAIFDRVNLTSGYLCSSTTCYSLTDLNSSSLTDLSDYYTKAQTDNNLTLYLLITDQRYNETILALAVNNTAKDKSNLTYQNYITFNLTSFKTNLTLSDCAGTDRVVGVAENGSVVCGVVASADNCDDGHCATVFYWANQSFLNETNLALAVNNTAKLGVAVNSTAQQALTINQTANIQSLLAGTNISQYAFNQTANLALNGDNSSWNESYANTKYLQNNTYNVTYHNYAANVSKNYTEESFNLWGTWFFNQTQNLAVQWLFNQTANLVLNGDNESWNESYANTRYLQNNTFNATYHGYATNVSKNYTENVFNTWGTWFFNQTANLVYGNDNASWNESYAGTQYLKNNTFNSTYHSYPTQWNLSINEYLSKANVSYLSTFNTTYDSFTINVSKNYTEEVYNTYSPFWQVSGNNESWNESYANTLYLQNNTFNATYHSYADNVSKNWTLLANSTYGVWWFNQTANLVLGTDNSSWNQSYADTRYLQNNTFNQTYHNYALNVSKNWSENTFSIWGTWFFNQTANLVYGNDNSSWNESYANTLYLQNNTFNSTYHSYADNVSKNWSEKTFGIWGDWFFNQTANLYLPNWTTLTKDMMFTVYGGWWFNQTANLLMGMTSADVNSTMLQYLNSGTNKSYLSTFNATYHQSNLSNYNLALAVNKTAALGVAVNSTAQLALAINSTAQQALTINQTANIWQLIAGFFTNVAWKNQTNTFTKSNVYQGYHNFTNNITNQDTIYAGNITYYPNGCYRLINATGVYDIC